MTMLLTWLTISVVVGFFAWLISALYQGGCDEVEIDRVEFDEVRRDSDLARKQGDDATGDGE